ncbi:outer membrane receptor protein involved in Fe transport [Devosia sp. UYZn731]|uniref:hypothetical protein n=1 Tax=Devosia sp. UYZn731 TaxID=3156345 RepID=UPI0033995D58
MSARYEGLTKGDGQRREEASAEVSYEFAPQWSIAAGLLHVNSTSPRGGGSDSGFRTDGGLELTYRADDDTKLYAFAQATLARSGTEATPLRETVGGKWLN